MKPVPKPEFLENSPPQASHEPVRAKCYRVGDAYTVIVVQDGEHMFFETDYQDHAEWLVGQLEG